ncbi:uncharacterized protein FFFS_05085 [Fusarium fujikuroi]|nr:uncharacterized protein FFFS_05085 [Fusarium fujikuroi]
MQLPLINLIVLCKLPLGLIEK